MRSQKPDIVTTSTFTSALAYDDAGRRTNLTLPNGVKVLYRYDSASRLTNLTYQAAVTNRIDYAYDEAGNRSSQLSALSIYLLPSAVTNSTYNAANQQTAFGSYTIQYDATGNVTNIVSGSVTNRLQWNARNQLTNLTGSVAANFLYDGLGRRITRTVSAATEKYLYDGLDIILQKDSAANIRGRYFRGLGIDEPWQRIDYTPAGGSKTTETNRTYLADALGSIVALTDPNKAIQTEYDYQPFGVTTNTGSANKNSFKFTGREDDGTGLYYYQARYYNPVLDRFVSEDPIRYLGGDINLYAYGRDNPVVYTDPTGLEVYTVRVGIGIYGIQVKWGTTESGRPGMGLAWAVGVHAQLRYAPDEFFDEGTTVDVTAGMSEGTGKLTSHFGWEGRAGMHFGKYQDSGATKSETGIHGAVDVEGSLGPLTKGVTGAYSLGTSGQHKCLKPSGTAWELGPSFGFTLGWQDGATP